MKKMFFLLFAVLMIVQGRAQTMYVTSHYGQYYSNDYECMYYPIGDGFLCYEFTVYGGAFENGTNNRIAINISSDDADHPFVFNREQFYSNTNADVTFYGTVFLANAQTSFIIDMSFNSNNYLYQGSFLDCVTGDLSGLKSNFQTHYHEVKENRLVYKSYDNFPISLSRNNFNEMNRLKF